MSGSIDEDPATWERDEIFDEIEKLPDLNSSKSRFLKRPNSQEATVAAIFFELVGNQTISEIRPLISGYKGRYDLYAKWGRRKLVIEFKYDLVGLLKDFNEERKMFDEIDCVVIWEITERDRKECNRRGISINKIQESSLGSRTTLPLASHELQIDYVKGIYVIELMHLL